MCSYREQKWNQILRVLFHSSAFVCHGSKEQVSPWASRGATVSAVLTVTAVQIGTNTAHEFIQQIIQLKIALVSFMDELSQLAMM